MIKVILLRAPSQKVNVLLSNITFIIFAVFDVWNNAVRHFFYYICCFSILPIPSNFIDSESGLTIRNQSRIRRLDTWRHRARYHSTPHRPLPTYWWCFETKPLSPAVFEILACECIGSRPWPFRVTWRHRSRDHLIPRYPFPIGGPTYLLGCMTHKATSDFCCLARDINTLTYFLCRVLEYFSHVFCTISFCAMCFCAMFFCVWTFINCILIVSLCDCHTHSLKANWLDLTWLDLCYTVIVFAR